MPTYNFKDKETGDITIRIMKMSELDAYKEANPNLETYIDSPMVTRSINMGEGLLKGKNAGFKEVLQNIDRRTPGSCLKYTTDI
jgi:hypothetical protein